MHPRVQWAVAKAQSAVLLARAFDPNEPRDEGGKWTDGGGDGGDSAPSGDSKPSSDTGGKKGKADFADFAKDNVTIDTETRSNPDKQKKFVDKWNAYVGEAPAQFKKDFLGGHPATMAIRYDEAQDAMTVSGSLKDADGNTIGEYTRGIDLDQKKAFSTYFKLNDYSTGHSVGKTVLRSNVAMYQKMGINEVQVHADIDVGGYAWAKYGYVPDQRWWRSLADEVNNKIDRMSGSDGSGGGGGDASSWEELSSGTQHQIETAFMNQSNPEFYDSEVDNWRQSGGPLEAAKEGLAFSYQEGRRQDWADHAIDGVQKDLADHGKPVIPFSNKQLLNAISVEYSGDGEGTGNLKVSFDDSKLREPQGKDPAQPTLPGITAVEPHEHLTLEMRDSLDDALKESFDSEAHDRQDDVSAPDYLEESAQEAQREYWDSMEESDRFDWAKRNEPSLIEGQVDQVLDQLGVGTEKMSEEDADRLRTLTASSDPKALWAIANSKFGKQLLLGSDWYGTLNLKDKETMDRFNAYVGKTSKAA